MQVCEEQHVCTSAEECGIPGLYLLHDFVTEQEEEVRVPPCQACHCMHAASRESSWARSR